WNYSDSGELRDILRGEPQRRGRDVLLEVLDRAGAGNEEHRRRAREEPGERHLKWRRVVPGRHPLDRRAFDVPCAEWIPGQERETLQLASVDHRVRIAVGEAVAVLDRDHGNDLLS